MFHTLQNDFAGNIAKAKNLGAKVRTLFILPYTSILGVITNFSESAWLLIPHSLTIVLFSDNLHAPSDSRLILRDKCMMTRRECFA